MPARRRGKEDCSSGSSLKVTFIRQVEQIRVRQVDVEQFFSTRFPLCQGQRHQERNGKPRLLPGEGPAVFKYGGGPVGANFNRCDLLTGSRSSFRRSRGRQ